MDFNHERLEKRSVSFSDVDIADGLKFRGYAAIYGQEADLGEFTEEVARGAFRNVLLPKRGRTQNVPMLYDHDTRHPPLATTGGKTLRLKEDTNGLLVEADLDEDHYLTPTIRSMIRRGDITGMSFGFVAGPGNSKMEQRGGKPHRVITGFKYLLDVSPTWEPAYEGTSAEMRNALVALRMAEEIDGEQQVLAGTYQQREDGDPGEVDTDAAPAEEPTREVTTETVKVETEKEQVTEPAGDDANDTDEDPEQRNALYEARRRRLRTRGFTTP